MFLQFFFLIICFCSKIDKAVSNRHCDNNYWLTLKRKKQLSISSLDFDFQVRMRDNFYAGDSKLLPNTHLVSVTPTRGATNPQM